MPWHSYGIGEGESCENTWLDYQGLTQILEWMCEFQLPFLFRGLASNSLETDALYNF